MARLWREHASRQPPGRVPRQVHGAQASCLPVRRGAPGLTRAHPTGKLLPMFECQFNSFPRSGHLLDVWRRQRGVKGSPLNAIQPGACPRHRTGRCTDHPTPIALSRKCGFATFLDPRGGRTLQGGGLGALSSAWLPPAAFARSPSGTGAPVSASGCRSAVCRTTERISFPPL
jgi:hypothetical protein